MSSLLLQKPAINELSIRAEPLKCDYSTNNNKNKSLFSPSPPPCTNHVCRNIIEEFRNGFYSLMNHFYVLGAELLEKFLICGECNVPIGFVHQCGCSVREENERRFKWKKVARDDKFITFDMRFSFEDLLDPQKRKEIVSLIGRTTSKQIRIGNHEKTSLPLATKSSWPAKWNRAGCRNRRLKVNSRTRISYPIHIVHPPIFHPSAWTPTRGELLKKFVSFSYHPQE